MEEAPAIVQLWHVLYCCSFGKLVVVMMFCFRAPAISFLSETAAAGPFKPWEVEDSEAQLKVDLEVYSGSPHTRGLYYMLVVTQTLTEPCQSVLTARMLSYTHFTHFWMRRNVILDVWPGTVRE